MRFNLYVNGKRTTVNCSDDLYDLFAQVMVMTDKAATHNDVEAVAKEWLQEFLDSQETSSLARSANNFLRVVVSAVLYGYPTEYQPILDYYTNGQSSVRG